MCDPHRTQVESNDCALLANSPCLGTASLLMLNWGIYDCFKCVIYSLLYISSLFQVIKLSKTVHFHFLLPIISAVLNDQIMTKLWWYIFNLTKCVCNLFALLTDFIWLYDMCNTSTDNPMTQPFYDSFMRKIKLLAGGFFFFSERCILVVK
jgi:hypothetical protein